MGQLGQFAPFLLVILIVFFYRKNQKKIMNKEINQRINDSEITTIQDIEQISIPDTCPHCKNPNSKKIRLCEWCGNQIV